MNMVNSCVHIESGCKWHTQNTELCFSNASSVFCVIHNGIQTQSLKNGSSTRKILIFTRAMKKPLWILAGVSSTWKMSDFKHAMKSRVGIWQGFDTIKKPPQEPKTQYQWTFKKMHFSRARDSCKRGGPHGLAAWWAFWIWTRPSCRGEWNVKEIVHVAAVEMSRRDAYSYLHLRNVMNTIWISWESVQILFSSRFSSEYMFTVSFSKMHPGRHVQLMRTHVVFIRT